MKKLFCIALCIMAASFVACSDGDPVAPVVALVELSADALEFTADGGIETITVSPVNIESLDLMLVSNQPWVKVTAGNIAAIIDPDIPLMAGITDPEVPLMTRFITDPEVPLMTAIAMTKGEKAIIIDVDASDDTAARNAVISLVTEDGRVAAEVKIAQAAALTSRRVRIDDEEIPL